MEEKKVLNGVIVGGATGFVLLGAALLPFAMPALLATYIASAGMVGGAFVGGEIAANMSDD